MSLATRAVRGTLYVLLGSYANMGIGFVYGIIMARLLDPAHFGIFALALFFFNLVDLRGKLGLDYALIHRQPVTEPLLATHWLLQIGASAISLILVLLAALVVPAFGYSVATGPIMVAVAVAALIESAGTTPRAMLEKELVFARSTVVVTGALFLSYAAAVVMALYGWTYWALVGQLAVNAAAGSIGFWWSFRNSAQRDWFRLCFDRATALWMLRYGAVMIVGAIATMVLLQFDNFLVGTLAGATALGFYAQAYKIAQWPTGLVTHIISRTSMPTYAKLQNDAVRLAKAFEFSLWVILTVAVPLALAFFVSAPDFIRLFYGDKWLPAAVLLRCLIAYSVLRPLLDDTGALFTAIGKPQKITAVLTVQAVTLVVLATPLTLLWGAIGTAAGVGGTFIVGIALTYYLISRELRVNLGWVFVPSAVAAVVSVGLYLMMAAMVDLNGLPLWLRVGVKAGTAVAIFVVMVVALEREVLIGRIDYLWRLLHGTPA